MPYQSPLTYEDVSNALAYDPDTGVFTWKVSPAKNIKAGYEAGCIKASRVKNGKPISYRYIRLMGQEVTAVRLAWLLHHGEWPTGKLYFVDENPLNLRIANIRTGNSLLESYNFRLKDGNSEYLKAHRAAFPEAWKNTHLLRRFDITLADYSAMHTAQNGVCAICKQPETQTRGGKVKALAVDHNHDTGAIRALLCSDCNTGIGKLKDDPAVLRAAAEYLEHHAAKADSLDPKEGLMQSSTQARALQGEG